MISGLFDGYGFLASQTILTYLCSFKISDSLKQNILQPKYGV